MTDKIKILPTATDKMKVALSLAARNADYLIEYNGIQARITRGKFNSLVKEGFTKEQALELCK